MRALPSPERQKLYVVAQRSLSSPLHQSETFDFRLLRFLNYFGGNEHTGICMILSISQQKISTFSLSGKVSSLKTNRVFSLGTFQHFLIRFYV